MMPVELTSDELSNSSSAISAPLRETVFKELLVNPIRRAFTLIELLVVITIIVVLLALLAPALDKAIYQAELAVCGANAKGIASGAVVYATNFKRSYPYRVSPGYPRELKVSTAATDDRPRMMPFIPLKLMIDPLAGRIDLGMEANDVDTRVHSNYSLFFGYRFAGRPMLRLGQTFEWQGDKFNVLAMDHDRSFTNQAYVRHSHPETRGSALSLYFTQNVYGTATLVAGQGVGNKWTESGWYANNKARGPVDENVAFDDGSVIRYKDVAMNQWQTEPARFSTIPDVSTTPPPGAEFEQLPVLTR